MERPKSAKYNIERYKSSISYSSSNSNRKNGNRIAAKQPQPQLPNRDEYLDINKNDLSLVTPSPAQFIIDDDDDDDRVYSNAKQKRLQTSKSAYVAGSLRPQSAKHDLEKYRQDVLLERKKKLEKLNQPNYNNNVNSINPISNNNNNAGESTVTNDKNSTTLLADDDENDFQNLGNVIIRDDVDSSDDDDKSADEADEYLLIDNQPSYKNNNQLKDANNKNNSSKTNNNPTANKSSKLLNKRNTGAVVGNGRQATSNLPNKTASLNHYTTFRPTAVTTNYSTSLPNDDEDPASILVNQHQHQHQQSLPGNNNKQTVTSMSDYGTSKPTNVANLNNKIIKLHSVNKQLQHTNNGAHDVTNAGLDGSNNTTVTTTITHSSSSTSSTRSRAPVPAEQPPPPPPLPPTDDSIHLTYELNINRKKNTSNIELTSKELLKEWFRKDEEFDMLIDDYNFQKNPPPPANNRNHVNNPNPNNGGNNSNSNSRTTTRLSDYSSNTTLVNKNNNTTTNNNNTAAKIVPIRINRDKSNLMDPWAKRNPSLIAQNVLSKHRAELEQLAASRNLNNNSQTSNASNIALPNMNKFLLPDSSKYYKK